MFRPLLLSADGRKGDEEDDTEEDTDGEWHVIPSVLIKPYCFIIFIYKFGFWLPAGLPNYREL
jgi:hypothetical protein